MTTHAHHQIAFVRHARSMYSNVYPDITQEGIEELLKTGEALRNYLSTTHRIIASPAVRAQSSARILANILGYKDTIHTEEQLADMRYANWPAAKEIFEQSKTEHNGVENIYDLDERFEDASIFEPRSLVRRRFYEYFGDLITHLLQSKDPQNILIVSHFEILNHFKSQFFPDGPWLGAGKSFLLKFDATNTLQSEIVLIYEGCLKKISFSDFFTDIQKRTS